IFSPIHLKAQTTVYVDNVTDFFKALGSNRTIVLKPGDYHLEKIDTTLENANCNWAMVLFDEIYYDEKTDDYKTLLLPGAENLTIKSGSREPVRILTNRKAASVLAFKSCTNVKLEGIIFGHDVPKSYTDPADPFVSFCSGEVLEFMDCNKVEIKSAVLFGCGTRGFLAHRCKDLSVEKTTITECSYGAFGIFDTENISFKKCAFVKNTYRWLFEIVNCQNLTVKKSGVYKNTKAEYNEGVVKMETSENIALKKFKLNDNDFTSEYFYHGWENHQP
ncbi:MAG TPA: right-handed parallel beta-helix repeat-containing protein, partial [Flavobacteriales bacterium]|nr:right-handed parallel beta-helix repeat-containing protein [Flavobacteriales bacterium]